ncbi:MAG: carbohydrate ABC transporter permease [Peptostreptococcaceae bacterium]|mgnify:CR=1 FL=1|nr:carbohydrate ABC transporter permease [Peptostreptococcaceae bacterium]MDU4934751.1 carbohydrate ABC transporter permease [Peptostreptococcaceae bacterium]
MDNKLKKWGLNILGLILGLICLSPFYIIIVNSFKTKGELFESTLALPSSASFSNYIRAWEQLDFIKVLGNSLFITVISVLLIIIFSAMAAWMIQRTNSKLANGILFLFISSMIVTFQSIMLPLISIAGKLNLLNVPGIIFMYIGFGCASAIFLYHGFIKGIPKELDEAAIIDGCSKWQTFRYIIFPLLKPTTITVAILNTVWIWNDFLLPSLIINTPETRTIPLAMYFFFGQYTKQWDLALAGLVLTIIPVLVFYFFAQKHIIKSVVSGSIK